MIMWQIQPSLISGTLQPTVTSFVDPHKGYQAPNPLEGLWLISFFLLIFPLFPFPFNILESLEREIDV